MDNGYLKLFRCMTDWEWYSNIPTCRLFLHILLKANWKDGRFQGKVIPVGSFVTSVGHLSESTGLSVRQVRTALNNLKSTQEITVRTTNKYSVISVVNWAKFQCQDDCYDKQMANKGQTNDNQMTTIEESKKERKKEVSKRERKTSAFIPPTLEDIKAYVKEKGYDVDPKGFFDYFTVGDWKDSQGKPVKNWKQKIITWANKGTSIRNKMPRFDYEQREYKDSDFEHLYLDLDSEDFDAENGIVKTIDISKKGAN